MAEKDKETPGAKRLRREQEIIASKKNPFGLYGEMEDKKRSAMNPIRQLISGKNAKELLADSSEYGTQLSAGAEAARTAAMNRQFNEEGATIGEAMMNEKTAKAGREAAAEERREARGMKKGGAVKSASARADGIAQRGKTKGKIY